MSRAMVLCAGLGTRLRPLTDELPKPLVPIGDRSILAHVADQLVAHGFASMVLNTHWLPGAFPHVLERLPIASEVVHEPKIRGTAGGVAGARHLLGPAPVLVWNGDILVTAPIGELMARAGDGLCLAVVGRAPGEGTVGRDAAGRIVRLRGEVFGQEVAGGDYVGVAALGSRCLFELPEFGCLVGDWALPELRRGGTVLSVDAPNDWADAGDPRSYHSANQDWLRRQGLESWVGEGASVAPSVTLQRSIVGAGARVAGEGTLSEVVLWPGAQAEAPLEKCIVTTRGQVIFTE